MPTTVIDSNRRRTSGTVTEVIREQYYYGGRYTWSARCVDHDRVVQVDDRTAAYDAARYPASFCSSCTGPRNRAEAGVNRAERRAASPRRQAAPLGLSRRFGVEFEFFGIRRATVETWLIDSGMRSNGWRVKSDPSVSGEALELISPPLTGEDGLTQMRTVLTWLNANGGKVNRTCGTHVHHDAADLTLDACKRFVKTYVANQKLIDWLVSPSRRTVDNFAEYCAGWSERDLTQLDEVQNRLYCHTRYKTVNVQAYGRHGTLEVRQHQGTLSYEKVVAWIKLGQAMMDAAKDRARHIPEQAGLRTFFGKLNVDEDAAAFLLGRALQFEAPMEAIAGAVA